MVIHIVRLLYLLVVLAFTTSYAFQADVYDRGLEYVTLYVLIPALAAGALVLVDMFWRRKHLQVLSGLFFGLLAGLVIAFVLAQIAEFTGQVFVAPGEAAKEAAEERPLVVNVYLRNPAPAPTTGPADDGEGAEPEAVAVPARHPVAEDPAIALAKVLLGVSAVFLSVSFVLQTKDDFRFVIPYVEFAKQTKGARPILLDTSVIIDGRIADIAETRIFESQMVVPRFILKELQAVADSADKLKRNRGRRGLDVLNTLRESKNLDLRILDAQVPAVASIAEIDAKLVALASHLNGRILTNDYNLNKVAQLRGVDVININDLANALKPVVLPGETMSVKIIKPGEEAAQGVGYLEDGTMVVVEQGKDHIGREVTITVTSALQTSAGRMIFGRLSESTYNHRRPNA
jgi:rRNA-processing protein FCF1